MCNKPTDDECDYKQNVSGYNIFVCISLSRSRRVISLTIGALFGSIIQYILFNVRLGSLCNGRRPI